MGLDLLEVAPLIEATRNDDFATAAERRTHQVVPEAHSGVLLEELGREAHVPGADDVPFLRQPLKLLENRGDQGDTLLVAIDEQIVSVVQNAHRERLLEEAQILVLRPEEDVPSPRGQADPCHPRRGHTRDRLPAFRLMGDRLARWPTGIALPTCERRRGRGHGAAPHGPTTGRSS